MSEADFWRGARVLVTGGNGFIGARVVANLVERRGLPAERVSVPRSSNVDLRVPAQALKAVEGCDVIVHLAAVTGGISFSRAHPATQYHDTTLIDLNVVEAARRVGVRKLVALGNLFAYAADAPVPLEEGSLFDGLPSESHRGVGWMKRNLAILADLYQREHGLPMVVVYSANAYGPGDSTDPTHSHVIPATIMKCLRDSDLLVWGDGSPTRDFLYVDDVAEGILLATEKLAAPGFVNLGSGSEVSIKDLVTLIARHARLEGEIRFDATKAGGDARRCSSTVRAKELLGFHPSVPIDEGIRRTVEWYRGRLGQG